MQRNQSNTESAFAIGEGLTPKPLYFSAIGLFESSGYNLVCAVQVPLGLEDYAEGARIYEKNGEYHVLYYPGRDNDLPVSGDSRSYSLRDIIDQVDTCVDSQYRDALLRAKKHFLICENNTYFGAEVDHYIYATLIGNTFTTEDSIKRQYDLSYLTKLIAHETHHHKAHGWQDMLLDTWQCGHYVLQALKRDINNIKRPEKLSIDQAILSEHTTWKAKGLEVFQKTSKDQVTLYDNIPINKQEADDDFDDLLSSKTSVAKPTRKKGFFERYGAHIVAVTSTWATAGAGLGFTVGFLMGAPFAGIGGLVAGGILAAIGAGVGAAVGFCVGCVAGLVKDNKATQPRPLINTTDVLIADVRNDSSYNNSSSQQSTVYNALGYRRTQPANHNGSVAAIIRGELAVTAAQDSSMPLLDDDNADDTFSTEVNLGHKQVGSPVVPGIRGT